MAKGQKRSTRELKKPKANKKLVAPGLAAASHNKTIVSSIALKKKD